MALINIQTEKKNKDILEYLFLILMFLLSCSGIVWYFYSGHPAKVKNILYVYIPMGMVASWGGITGNTSYQWSAAIPAVFFFMFSLCKLFFFLE
jgi:hypothetical protein